MLPIGSTKSLLEEVSRALSQLQGQDKLLVSQLERQETILSETSIQVTYHTQALELLQELERHWRGAFEGALAAVVSRGISTVFGRPLTINIESKVFRGVGAMNLTITEGENTTGILGAEGGSLIEVLDFLLRVLLTLSSRPPLRKLLVLDEPFPHVSQEFRGPLCELLREMANQLDFQVILVSHEPELVDAADFAYEIIKPKDRAVIEQLKTSKEEVE